MFLTWLHDSEATRGIRETYTGIRDSLVVVIIMSVIGSHGCFRKRTRLQYSRVNRLDIIRSAIVDTGLPLKQTNVGWGNAGWGGYLRPW